MKKTIFLLAALLPLTVFGQGGFRRGFLVLPDTSTNNVQTKAEVSAQIAAEVSGGGVGDITSVVAGAGLTGGATSGAATVDLNPKLAGRTITVTSDSVHVTAASLDSSHIKTAGVDDGAIRNQAVGPNQLANTAVTAAAYTLPSITFDADGRATAAASVTTLTGIDAVVTDLDLTSAASGNVIMRRTSGVWVDTTLSASYDSSTAVGDAGWTATSTTTSLVSGVVEARVGGTSKRQVWYDGDGDTLRIRTQPSGTSQWFQWKQGTTVKAAIDTNGNFSSPDASGGSGSEKFGASITHSGGDRNTVVGANSSLTSSSSSDNVLLGQNIDITGAGSDDNVFIGSEHQATAGTISRTINIGWANTIPSGVGGTIILGNAVHNFGTVGSNECWIGGTNPMNNMWLGSGKTVATTAVNVAVNVTNITGTNVAGGTFTIKSGLGTGTGASGNINLQVGDPLGTGTTQHTAYNRVTITGVGAASAAPTDSTFNSQGGHFSQGLLVGGTITAGSGAVAITNSTGNLDGTKVANADLGDISVSSGAWTVEPAVIAQTAKDSTGFRRAGTRLYLTNVADSIRVGIASTGGRGKAEFGITDAGTANNTAALVLSHETSGTPTTDYGTGLNYYLDNASSAPVVAGALQYKWNNSGASSSRLEITTRNSGTHAVKVRLSHQGQLKVGNATSEPTAARLHVSGEVNENQLRVTGFSTQDSLLALFETSAGTRVLKLDNSGNVDISGKVSFGISTLTLSAAVTTFAVTKTVHTIDGDAGGNTVATITGGVTGMLLTLKFIDASVTITDDGTSTANTVNLSAAFTSSANDVMTLLFDGTSWLEVSRSVN